MSCQQIGRPICWQQRQPNRPLSDSSIEPTIESAGEQTVQNIDKGKGQRGVRSESYVQGSGWGQGDCLFIVLSEHMT